MSDQHTTPNPPIRRLTVAGLIEALRQYPSDAIVWAYEGEKVGVGIRLPDRHGPQIGFIDLEWLDEPEEA